MLTANDDAESSTNLVHLQPAHVLSLDGHFDSASYPAQAVCCQDMQ